MTKWNQLERFAKHIIQILLSRLRDLSRYYIWPKWKKHILASKIILNMPWIGFHFKTPNRDAIHWTRGGFGKKPEAVWEKGLFFFVQTRQTWGRIKVQVIAAKGKLDSAQGSCLRKLLSWFTNLRQEHQATKQLYVFCRYSFCLPSHRHKWQP